MTVTSALPSTAGPGDTLAATGSRPARGDTLVATGSRPACGEAVWARPCEAGAATVTAPLTTAVVGTNDCRIFATLDERAQRVIVVAAIDNLMKGAAGQAVQNLNVMAGYPEHWGLT